MSNENESASFNAGKMLIGKSVLGQQFVQDPNPNWVKIDGVAIGESHQYGYNTVTAGAGGIGALLNNVASDPKVVCVVFNWNTQTGYLKSGFNLANASDSATAQGYTTFVNKARVTSNFTGSGSGSGGKGKSTPSPSPAPSPSSPTQSSQFVVWNSSTMQFSLNGNPFVPVGFNAYWMGMHEDQSYPTHAEIAEMFEIAVKMKATVIRSHTLGFSTASPNALRPGTSNDDTRNNLNDAAWEPIDYAFQQANAYGIKLVLPKTDGYDFYHGNYGDFCVTRGIDKTQFWTDPDVRNDFKQFLSDYLNHVNQYTGVAIKDDPALLFIELGNELGNIRPDVTSTSVPTQEWITDITTFISSIDSNHIVLDGSDECLGGSTSNDFQISNMGAYSAHFYWEDWDRLNSGASNAANLGKPYIIGEYASNFDSSWFSGIEGNKNVCGSIAWSIYPNVNGVLGGTPEIHNDGYTINWISSDMSTLTTLSNHFRRMQGLPTVDSLS